MKADDVILDARDVTMRFKGLVAVNNVTLGIRRGSITALIGPNGAGKTTLFNSLSGFLKGATGRVTFDGLSIEALPAYARCRHGLVRTFQLPKIFQRLTLLENMLVADRANPGERLFGCFYRRGAMLRQRDQATEKAMDLLRLLNIEKLGNDYAGTLSGGQRKLLELGRALMMDPKMVLLDEPMAGVNPALGAKLLDRVQYLRAERGITFLFVEHDMDMVMRVSDRVLVLDEGRLIADGTPDAVRADERVIDAYLGRAAQGAAA